MPIGLDEDGFPRAEDIATKVRELANAGADFLYVGSSSFLRANGTFLGAAAESVKPPLLSPYEETVVEGNALLSVAARYYDVGQLAGQLVDAILFEEKTPGDIPVAQMKEFAVTINLSVAKEIGLIPPVHLLQVAEVIE